MVIGTQLGERALFQDFDEALEELRAQMPDADELKRDAETRESQLRTERDVKASIIAAGWAAFCTSVLPVLDNFLQSKVILGGVVVAVAAMTFVVTLIRSAKRQDLERDVIRQHVKTIDTYAASIQDFDELLEVLCEEYRMAASFLIEREATQPPVEIVSVAQELLADLLRFPLVRTLKDRRALVQMNSEELRVYLLGLLQFCALHLEENAENRTVRCGLLIPHPKRDGHFLPLLTYSPGDNSYVSPHTFTNEDYPAWLVSRFKRYREQHGFQRFCWDYIGDVFSYVDNPAESPPKFQYKDPGQREYIRCLLGVVLYVREERDAVDVYHPVGLLNFDAPTREAFTSQRYELMLPFLKVAYRILTMRLGYVLENEGFIKAIYRRPLNGAR